MKVKEFNQLKRQVKKGNVEGLKEVIDDLTLKQAQTIEDLLMDLELTKEMNNILDEIVNRINSLAEDKKVANKKAPDKKAKKEDKKEDKKPAKKLIDTIKVGDVVRFRVEGEEITHDIKIIYKSKYDIIAITADEKEVFKIRKADFNKQIFEWTDRKGKTYNIIVAL